MERIKRLNSILFTVMSSFIIIAFIFLLIKLIAELIPRNYNRPDYEMISNELTAENAEENIRTQIISYDQLTLVDSLRNIYIMPVSQLKLEKPEELTVAYCQIPDFSYYYRSGSLFNNMIVVNLNMQKSRILFHKRICIVDYRILKIDSKKYLFMLACNTDTNKDNLIDGKDLLELYLYDFEKENIEILSKKPEHILDLDFITPRNQVLVTIGIDRNKDKIFNRQYEPLILKRIDLKTKEIVEILDEEVTNDLQSILDGATNN